LNGFNDFDVRQQQYLDQWCDASGDSFARWAESLVRPAGARSNGLGAEVAVMIAALGSAISLIL